MSFESLWQQGDNVAWFENCVPHYDIRAGKLDESIFAANLDDVVKGTAPEEYNSAEAFFAKTFVTLGLKDIVKRVVLALNGEQTENRVISLQTGFGGGKTHALIAIYHIAKAGNSITGLPSCADLFASEKTRPEFQRASCAVFTNNTTDVSQGRRTSEGITIHTMWGEIAYQLGGKDAYEAVRQNDEEMIAPGSAIMKPILQAASPCLILVDELADYCVKASGKKVAGGTLFNQTVSFVQSLTESVSQVPQCVLITTLPASSSEVASSEAGVAILQALNDRIVRVGTNVKPVGDEEIYEVVRRRLFEKIERSDAIENTVDQFRALYEQYKTDLPEYCLSPDYDEKMKKAYPFHPELIEIFKTRWGSDYRFQRTRGVLRLLASIVQDLWQSGQYKARKRLLILPSDVCLDRLDALTGTITSLMGQHWDSVIAADVSGSSSNACKIDSEETVSALGSYHLAEGISTTLLLCSVGALKNRGLTLRQLKLCVIRPDAFYPNDVDGTLNKLKRVAHYLHFSSAGEEVYRFETKPNVNILLLKERAKIDDEKMQKYIVTRLKKECQKFSNLNVICVPDADVREMESLTAIIMHPKYSTLQGDTFSDETTEAIKNIALNVGNKARVYRNTMFFVLCSGRARPALYEKTKEYLACEAVLGDSTYLLEDEQRADVVSKSSEADGEIPKYLAQAYCIAAKCQFNSETHSYEVVKMETMREFSNSFRDQIENKMVSRLKEGEWILGGIGKAKLQETKQANEQEENQETSQETKQEKYLFPSVDNPVSVQSIYDSFLKNSRNPMITSQRDVMSSLNNYCEKGVFNIAVGKPGEFTRVYKKERVPGLNAEDGEYWLVDSSVDIVPSNQNQQEQRGNDDTAKHEQDDNGKTKQQEQNDDGVSTESVVYKKITVSGSVLYDNYSRLWEIVNPLQYNDIKISVTIEAKSTEGSPLKSDGDIMHKISETTKGLNISLETQL